MRDDRHRSASACARSLREAGVILLLTLICTLAAWLMRSPRLPLIAEREAYEFEIAQPLVDAATALAYYEAGSHLFVDTRQLAKFDQARVPGAMSVRPESFEDDLSGLIDFIYPEDPILLYGDRLQGTAAVAGRFAERGYEDLTLLAGDFAAWREAGGPVDEPVGGGR
jgi:rhodanese-related sulfurtransferase